MSTKALYAMFDKTSKHYAAPFVQVNNATAIRDIRYAAKTLPDRPTWVVYPDQFELVCLGWYDEDSGNIHSEVVRVMLVADILDLDADAMVSL